MQVDFSGQVIEWRGPSPFYFVPLPLEASADIHEVATIVTYGWGVIPVEARIGDTTFTTSLFPKDDVYLLPLKNAVRSAEALSSGDSVTVQMSVVFKFD